jgi:hypothetical protein
VVNTPHDWQDQLDLFLDGLLPEAERAAFVLKLESSPELRAAVEAQRRIDDSLRRQFCPPSFEADVPSFGRAAADTAPLAIIRPAAVRRWKLWAAAAAVVLATSAVVSLIPRTTPLEELYQRQVALGFSPDVTCTSIPAFGQWLEENYGSRIAPDQEHPNIEYAGWSYSRTISGYTGLLLAKVEGRQVLVVLDKQAEVAARPPRPEAGKDLKVFRRDLGGLVFFEITPLGRSVIIDHLEVKAAS